MKISLDDVRHVASLARLRLGDEDARRFVAQLDSILGYVEKLDELDVTEVPPTSHVLDVATPFRSDEITNTPNADRLLANAPDRAGSFFRVPKIIE